MFNICNIFFYFIMIPTSTLIVISIIIIISTIIIIITLGVTLSLSASSHYTQLHFCTILVWMYLPNMQKIQGE